jgi:hypothetical protein
VTAEKTLGWRQQIREMLFVADPPPPVDAKLYSSFGPEPGIVAERLTYQTAYGQFVPAILYRPKTAKGKIPRLVVVNGHAGTNTAGTKAECGLRRLTSLP